MIFTQFFPEHEVIFTQTKLDNDHFPKNMGAFFFLNGWSNSNVSFYDPLPVSAVDQSSIRFSAGVAGEGQGVQKVDERGGQQFDVENPTVNVDKCPGFPMGFPAARDEIS